MFLKKSLCILLSICITISLMFSFDADTHDKILEEILIGNNQALLSKTGRKNIDLLNSASYLAIDFFNGSASGLIALNKLKSAGVRKLPKHLDIIDYTSNSKHQFYTHRGWNRIYAEGENKGNWEVRKSILINTSNTVFKKNWRMSDNKKEAFAAFVYYVHILGDHWGDSYTTRGYRLPMTTEPGYKHGDPTVYSELIRLLEILLLEQKKRGNIEYNLLMKQLNNNKDYFKDATPEQIKEENQKFAEKTVKILKTHLPKLFLKQEFFHKAFY